MGLNLPLAFAELLVGSIVLDAGIKGASIADVIKGQARQKPISPAAPGSVGSGLAGIGGTGAGTSGVGTGLSSIGSAGGGVGPFSSGATSSRLDQGQDVTTTSILAPVSGTIVQADASNSGWRGGGLVALRMDNPIAGLASDVLYFAEGLAPTVATGMHVTAGQPIATPAVNPYNGVVGNIEWGLANPNSPSEPVARLTSDARGAVLAFYNWARSIGAPVAGQTSNAGYP